MKLQSLLERWGLPLIGFPLHQLGLTLGSLQPTDISVQIPRAIKRIIPRSLSKRQALSLAQTMAPIFRNLCSLALEDDQRENYHAQLLTALDSVASEHYVTPKEIAQWEEQQAREHYLAEKEKDSSATLWTRSKAKRVRALVAKGLASKAMTFVHDETKIATGPEAELLVKKAMSARPPSLNQELLKELFPEASPAQIGGFSIETVRYALLSMNRGAAPGHSGLTIDHLQQMTTASDEFASALTALINFLVFNAKQALMPSMATVRLIGIWKNSEHTAVRVIAVQEALMRLASRLVQQVTKDLTLGCLSRFQMGYAVPDATAAIGLSIREACSLARTLRKDKVFVAKLDLAGAFDSVPFQVIQAAVSHAAWPKPLQEFVKLRQERETMHFGEELLTRAVGMPQGSSDSPAIFPLCLDPVLRIAAKDQPDLKVGPLTLPPILAYQDDVHLLSNSAAGLQAMIKAFYHACTKLGLRIRAEKCWTFEALPQLQSKRDIVFRLPDGEAGGPGTCLPPISWDGAQADILGVPFGSQGRTELAYKLALENINKDMDRLLSIPSALIPEEVKVYLALLCVPPRMSHLLRHSPCADHSAALSADEKMQKSLCMILDLVPTPNLCGVLTTPQRNGGWGLLVLEEAAKVAPRSALLSMVLNIDAGYPLHSTLESLLRLDPREPGATLFVREACTPTDLLPAVYNNPQSLATALGPHVKLQSHVYGLLMTERTKDLCKNLPETSYLRRFPARDYTFASPPKPYYPLGRALATRLQYIAGVSPSGILRRTLGSKCPVDNAVMTASHVYVCKGTAAICKTNMHDCTRSQLVRSVRSIPGAMVLEEHQMPVLHNRRLDFIAEIGGTRLGADLSFCEVTSDLRRNPKSILQERYKDKLRGFQGYALQFSKPNEPRLEIAPLVFTSFGTPSDKTVDFLKRVKALSGGKFKVKSVLHKIALISAHYNHQAVNFWRAAITRKLNPQSYERQTGSKWQSAFQRHQN